VSGIVACTIIIPASTYLLVEVLPAYSCASPLQKLLSRIEAGIARENTSDKKIG
jgi:hypothetical protein